MFHSHTAPTLSAPIAEFRPLGFMCVLDQFYRSLSVQWFGCFVRPNHWSKITENSEHRLPQDTALPLRFLSGGTSVGLRLAQTQDWWWKVYKDKCLYLWHLLAHAFFSSLWHLLARAHSQQPLSFFLFPFPFPFRFSLSFSPSASRLFAEGAGSQGAGQGCLHQRLITITKEVPLSPSPPPPPSPSHAAAAVSAYTQVKMEDDPKLLKLPPKSECPDMRIRLPRHKWPTSWWNIEEPVVLLDRNLYGHPLAGLQRERQFEKVLLENEWEEVPNWDCLFVIDQMWQKLMKHVDLGEPTSFLDYVYLGCTQRECEPKESLVNDYRKMFESRISAEATEKLPQSEKIGANAIAGSYDMEERAKNALNDSANWQTTTLGNYTKSAHPALTIVSSRRKNWKQWENCQNKCCQIVLTCLYLARIGRTDILWSVNKLARAVTTWTRACDRRLARLISYIHSTSDYMHYCGVGNAAQHCRLALLQDSDFAGDLDNSKSTSGGIWFYVSSAVKPFVPRSWMCKKQTAVSHSSAESGVISLDAGLRMDGVPTLDLWDLFVEVLHHSSDQTSVQKNLKHDKNCARGAGIHGDVLTVHTEAFLNPHRFFSRFFTVPQHTNTHKHTHTHTPNTHHDHQQHHDHNDTHHTTQHGDRQRETETDRNRERQRKRDKTRQEKRRRDKTRRQEKRRQEKREERRSNTREETRWKRREQKQDKRWEERRLEERRWTRKEETRWKRREKMKGKMKGKMKRDRDEKRWIFSKKCLRTLKPARWISSTCFEKNPSRTNYSSIFLRKFRIWPCFQVFTWFEFDFSGRGN